MNGSVAISHFGSAYGQSMRKSIGVHGNMPFDARNFLSCIVSFFLSRIGVFNALSVNDEECCFLVPTIA